MTVYDKTRHMGFFMKIAITSLLVLMTSELTTVQISERSLASFFSYDAFYLDHRKFYFEKLRSKRVAKYENGISVYYLYTHQSADHKKHAMRSVRDHEGQRNEEARKC